MSAPVSFIECVSKMAYTRVLSCVMLALIPSIITSIQLNLAIIYRQENYKRRRLILSRLLSTTTSTFTRVNFHHPLLSLLSFKEIDDQNLKK